MSINEFIVHLNRIESVSERTEALYKFTLRYLRNSNDLNGCFELIQQLETLGSSHQDMLGFAHAYHCYANYYGFCNNHNEALRYFNLAATHYDKLNRFREVADLTIDLGNFYYVLFQPEKSLPLYAEALEILKHNYDSYIMARAFIAWGAQLFILRKYAEGKDKLLQAYHLAEVHGYDLIFARASYFMLCYYLNQKDIAGMRSIYLKYIITIRKNGDKFNTYPAVCGLIGRMYLLLGDTKRAYRYLYKQILSLPKYLRAPIAHMDMVYYYLYMKQFKKAIFLLEKTLLFSEQNLQIYWIIAIYELLADTYVQQKDYKTAFYIKLKQEKLTNELVLGEAGAYSETFFYMKELCTNIKKGLNKEAENTESQKLFKTFLEKEDLGKIPEILSELTKKEIEVLGILSLGYSDKEIADSLFVSIHTIKTHLRSLFVKLNVKSRVELILMNQKLGLTARNTK